MKKQPATPQAQQPEQEPEEAASIKYRVLCWGACVPDRPCGINYPSTLTGKEVRAVTGDTIDDIDPESVRVNEFIQRGILKVVKTP